MGTQQRQASRGKENLNGKTFGKPCTGDKQKIS